jgi:hypothetical protein
MEYMEVELLLLGEVGHAGDERLLERPVIGPFREGAVDVGVMQSRLALGVLGMGRHFHCIPVYRTHKMRLKTQ